MPDFNNFSERSIKAINLAKEESHKLGHNFIGSEQLLIGLLGTDNGAAQLLNAAGVSLEAAQTEVEKVIGRGAGFVATEIPFTPKAKRAIEMAIEAALQGLVLVQPEHLLLGILDTSKATALKILENLGVSIPQLREASLTQIQQQQVPTPQQNRELESQMILLPAIPPVKSDAPRSLYATVLPQETGRWVAEVSTSGSGLRGPTFRSIGYGDTEYQAIAEALESVARMYRDYKNEQT